MSFKHCLNIIVMSSCLSSIQTTALAEPLVPLPSMPDYTEGDGWGVALGAALEYEGA